MSLIDRYLDEVMEGLGDRPVDRNRIASEIRSHIQELAAEYQRSGSTPEEALRCALGDMGNPRLVGRALREAYAPGLHLVPAGQAVPPPPRAGMAASSRALAAGLALLAAWLAGVLGFYLWPV